MRIVSVALALFSFSLTTVAQRAHAWDAIPKEAASATQAFSPELRNELSKIRDAAMADDYAYEQLEHLTDSIGPRPEGSLQADAAAHYVADELRKLGLEVHLEPVPVRRFVRGNDFAELVEYPGQVPDTKQKIVVTALYGNSPTPEGGITADVIVVHSFDELKALGREKVAGKVVLFGRPLRLSESRGRARRSSLWRNRNLPGMGAVAAAQLGAVASLVRSTGDGAYRLAHAGYSADAHIPAAALSAEDADLIARLAQIGSVRIHLSLPRMSALKARIQCDCRLERLGASRAGCRSCLDIWIPGTLGTGAIDDGAGVVVAMETAQLLHRLHLHPKRTIRVIAWMNEETGATGSDAYAKVRRPQICESCCGNRERPRRGAPAGVPRQNQPGRGEGTLPRTRCLGTFGASLFAIVTDSPKTDIEPLAGKGRACLRHLAKRTEVLHLSPSQSGRHSGQNCSSENCAKMPLAWR